MKENKKQDEPIVEYIVEESESDVLDFVFDLILEQVEKEIRGG